MGDDRQPTRSSSRPAPVPSWCCSTSACPISTASRCAAGSASGDAHVPIVILTARHSEVDVVLGLDAGADDYVTKPFRLAELLARVRAHLRRSSAITAAGGAGDRASVTSSSTATPRRVRVDGEEVELRAREFDLLAFLMDKAGVAVTRERIMSEVWDEHWFGPTKTLDMHISALRRKLGETVGDESAPSRITTLRGVGYRFELPTGA